ncbi:MbeB family mobilization protein [Escherichia coli]|uniref:MbeB family mobilization protein n=1 Tax=Escherichia coli TaxID=562 RepID=UPI00333554BF
MSNLLQTGAEFEKKLKERAESTEKSKRLARTVLIFTERSDQLSRATDRVPGLPANPGYAQ